MILDGGYKDGFAHYEQGDISHVDGSVDHAPVCRPRWPLSLPDGSHRPGELTGKIGRILNPFYPGLARL